MNALDNRIRELVAYAREKDGEDRTSLFRNLVDMFLTGKAPHKNPTRSQLLDVIDALIPHVEAETRKTVAGHLAGMTNPPMDLVHRIARDRASLVGVLLQSAPFTEEDLLDLVETTGREHHQAIACRNDLSANVWIALARATPAAPPYESQSTLALWADDLGVTGINASATVTRLHPDRELAARPDASSGGGTAKLRILRTDEDLMGDLMEQNDPLGDLKLSGGLPDKEQAGKKISREGNGREDNGRAEVATKSTTPSDLKPSSQKSINPTPSSPAPSSSVTSSSATSSPAPPSLEDLLQKTGESAPYDTDQGVLRPHHKLPEAGPGGWSWLSDRDGRIVTVSKLGLDLFGEKEATMQGMPMVEMLGLGMKIGHPVARAFQRRSNIHDAPLYLSHLDKGQRYWTLEARPVFSTGEGLFEGYEGVLLPVVPAEDEEDIIPAQDDTDSLASSELVLKSRPSFNEPAPDRDVPLFVDDVEDDQPPLQGQVSAQTPPRTAADHDPNSLIRESLTDALGGLGDILRTAPAPDTAVEAQQAATVPDTSNPGEPETRENPDGAPVVPTALKTEKRPEDRPVKGKEDPTPKTDLDKTGQVSIMFTLDMLQESLDRLNTANRTDNIMQIRLQSEIAIACARSLREQLKAGFERN